MAKKRRSRPARTSDTTSAEKPLPAQATERGLSHVDEFLLELVEQQERANAGAGPQDAPPLDSVATSWTELDLLCPRCQIVHHVPICTFLNAIESAHLVERVRRGQFNLKRCPLCHQIEPVDYPWTYYDAAERLAVQVRPAWEWHAGGGEEWYAARLEDFFERWAEQEVRIDVVFGQEQLIERYLSTVTPGATSAESGTETPDH